jgi:sugar phosphate isomerase/epimerase
MRLGGPVFDVGTDPQAWADAHRRLGYSAAFLPEKLVPDAAALAACVDAAKRADLLLAEVGAWSNPISRDEEQRRQAIELCCRRLDLADRAGVRCCVNIAGSRGEVWDGPHPDNLSADTFDLVVQTVRAIIDAVRPMRTAYALETMPWIFPDSPDSYLDLIRAIDRKAFGVHLDPVNMINCPARAYRTGDFLRECFASLGPHILGCHAKDIRFTRHLTRHLDECRPGTGLLDYRVYLSELSKLPPDTPLMIEHMPSPEEYTAAADYIRQVARAAEVELR